MTSGEMERKREGKVAVGGHGGEMKDRAGQMKAMDGGVADLLGSCGVHQWKLTTPLKLQENGEGLYKSFFFLLSLNKPLTIWT